MYLFTDNCYARFPLLLFSELILLSQDRELFMMKSVAIVTGGTGGIGTAICQRLTADFQVVACYFKQGKHTKISNRLFTFLINIFENIFYYLD